MQAKNLIGTYNYTEENYNPVLMTEKWQVAYLNSCPEYELKAINKVDVHENTDEAFILLEGRAVLIAAEVSIAKTEFDLLDMVPGTTYNIPSGVWHNIVLLEKTRVLIVENAYTHLYDFQFHYFSVEQTRNLHNQINTLLTKKNHIL